MFRILLTHTPAALALQFPPKARDALARHGTVMLNPTGAVLEGASLAEAARGCDLVIADRQTAVGAAFFDAAPDVLAVMRCAVDISTIDVAAASAQGVLVTRSIPTFAASVAELALGLIIDAARGISRATTAYRAGRTPEIAMGAQLSGQTLGICGFGVIGRYLAALAQALGMQVIITDPAPGTLPGGIRAVPFETLLGASDVVVCLAPATPQTAGMFGAQAFGLMKPSAIFVNLARAALLDETALEQALEHGQIACAAMDVGSAPDQRPAPALAGRADVIATPHIGGQTPQAAEGQALHVVEQVAQMALGRVPDEAVNAADATRFQARLATRPPADRSAT
ncbi:NAD(P)-dependent oxidoreductase [Pseudooceanicola sediminis]|nr:NAD(P)-dependent oxidoreductase [Pseudooceanicola sediminis]